MKSTAYLTEEHKTILRTLNVLDAMADWMERRETVDPAEVQTLLDFLNWYGDTQHQEKEEAILFPALVKFKAGTDDAMQHMIHEHQQERTLLKRLTEDLRFADHSDFASVAEVLSSRLRTHIYKEDEIMFAAADPLITPEEDEVLLKRLEDFTTDDDRQQLETGLANLRDLEWKYLSR